MKRNKARNLPDNIEKEREKFAEEVNEAGSPEINGERVCIPPELVLNWDQTGSNLVPISEWTLASEGSRQGAIKALDDKRQITILLCITMSGQMLPPQGRLTCAIQLVFNFQQIGGDRKLDRDSHSHSRNNLIGRTCENVIHEWILSKRRGSLVTDLLSKKRELFHTCYL